MAITSTETARPERRPFVQCMAELELWSGKVCHCVNHKGHVGEHEFIVLLDDEQLHIENMGIGT